MKRATVNRRLWAALRSPVRLARSFDLVPWALDVPGKRQERYRDTHGPDVSVPAWQPEPAICPSLRQSCQPAAQLGRMGRRAPGRAAKLTCPGSSVAVRESALVERVNVGV